MTFGAHRCGQQRIRATQATADVGGEQARCTGWRASACAWASWAIGRAGPCALQAAGGGERAGLNVRSGARTDTLPKPNVSPR